MKRERKQSCLYIRCLTISFRGVFAKQYFLLEIMSVAGRTWNGDGRKNTRCFWKKSVVYYYFFFFLKTFVRTIFYRCKRWCCRVAVVGRSSAQWPRRCFHTKCIYYTYIIIKKKKIIMIITLK